MNARDGRAVLVLALAIHAVFLASLAGQFLNPLFCEASTSVGQAGDYFGIYTAGDQLLRGYSIYDSADYLDEAPRRVPYYYFFRYLPPTAYLAAVTALVLPPWGAYVSWLLVNEVLLALIAVAILRLRGVDAGLRRTLAALWIGFFPFYLEQWMGQFSFLMAVFLWVLLRPALPDRPEQEREAPPRGWGMAAWAASIALKSFPALFALSYLRRRRVRPVVVGAALVLLACAPYYAARPEDLRQFLKLNMGMLPPEILDGAVGMGTLVRFLGWSLPQGIAGIRLQLAGQELYLGNLPVYLWMIAVLAGTGYLVARAGDRTPLGHQVVLWTLAFFLFYKEIWEYHTVMLLPIVTYLALVAQAGRRRALLLLGLWLALPSPYVILADRHHELTWAGKLVQHAWRAAPVVALYGIAAGMCLAKASVPRSSSLRAQAPPSARP